MFKLEDWPFLLGAMTSPNSFDGWPQDWELRLEVDPITGVLTHRPNKRLQKIMEDIYSIGLPFGTPLGPTEFASPSAADFSSWVLANTPNRAETLLEIGAGTGYLSSLFAEHGLEVSAIEPGKNFERYWLANEVTVTNDFFPSPAITGKFDVIVSYAVLEHIPEPEEFLAHVRAQLNTGGIVAFAVPDCSPEIKLGDPTILVHEHLSYFSEETLRRLFEASGFEADIHTSRVGRMLYVLAREGRAVNPRAETKPVPTDEHSYPARAQRFVHNSKKLISGFCDEVVGIYVPARALGLLPRNCQYRFFDDDSDLIGKYYPPFHPQVEGFDSLIENPPQTLVIATRTFHTVITERLRTQGFVGRIISLDELGSVH